MQIPRIVRKVAATFLLLVAVGGVVTPAHARFVGTDPVQPDANTGENFNRYAYANNNPYRYTDPDGRLPFVVYPIVLGASWLLKSGHANAPARGGPTYSTSFGEAASDFTSMVPMGRAAGVVRLGIDANKNRPEPAALSRGKRAHREEPVLQGERAEVATPSGKRMDRYNEETAHIREIKPDNARAMREGEKQVQRYKQEMDAATGRTHTTEVTPYDPTKYQP